MNKVMEELVQRKSVRSFTERPIEESVVQDILAAAVNAPTAGNQQLYSIIRITDPELLEELSKSCDNQPFIAKGKLVLLFCADCLKWFNAFRYAGCNPRLPGEGDLMIAIDDAVIAAQNAVTAAWSYGVGSCYIGDIMENIEIQRKLLKLPDYVFPAALVVFGYPTKQQMEREKPERAAMEFIVSENCYRTLGEEELKAMLEPRTGEKPYEEWMQAFCARKYNSDFSKEMTRSVREYLKQYADCETS